MATNISNLTFDNLVRSLYNYIQEDATLKETFTEFTTAEATRLFAELFAYVGQQLSNRMNVVGNELFIDTASTKGLSRLLKLVGYKIPFANSSSVIMTANRNWDTEYPLSSGLKQLYTEGGSTKCHINPIPNFYQVKNNALTFEFINFNQTTNKYDYIEQVKLTKSSSEDEEKTVYQGVTNAKEITLTSVNGASFIINEQVCANSIEVFYKECEGSGSLLSDFKVIKFNEVDNIFSREAILGKDSEGNDVGYYTTRNLGQGKTEVYYKPSSNDLNKKIVIVWRTTAGASGNISAGSINETRRVAIGNMTGTIHFTNKVAANYGTDEITDTDIRTYVTNEVRNSRVMVCPEDYEYIYKNNYPEIGFIRAFGESNTNFNALSETYGYYVNPLNVWLLILKSNTVLSQAYANDVEGLTDIINGICFQHTDVNPRIDEKYQINPGIVNREWIIGNLSNTNQYKYEFDVADSTAINGSNVYVANTKFLQGSSAGTFFSASDMVYSNLENSQGTPQNYISPITTGNSSTLYSQNERMITCPSWSGDKTFYSLKFKFNSGNDINCAGTKSAVDFVDYINSQANSTRTYNVVQLIAPSIQNLSDVLYTGSTASATMTITVNSSSTPYTISLTNGMTYQDFIDALNTAFGNSGFIAFAYKEVNCYEILVRKDSDPGAFSAQYDSTMATLIGKDASTTYNSEERVFYIADGDPSNTSRINASINSGTIIIRVTGDTAHADQITISGSSEDLAYFGFIISSSSSSYIIKRYRTVSLNKTTIDTTTKFDIAITTSGPQDTLSNYCLYIDAFKTASQNTILLGSYYANIDESTTIGKLLKRDAIKDLYPTTYIGDNKDAYNSEVFKLLMTLDSVRYATDVQVEDSDNIAKTYTIRSSSESLSSFNGQIIYIRNKNGNHSYAITSSSTIEDALSSFTNEIDFNAGTSLVESKLSGWDGGFCFKGTSRAILEYIFGSDETVYTVDGGLINATQRPYIVLPVNNDKYVVNGSFTISVNEGTADTISCGADFEAMSGLPTNIIKDNNRLVHTGIEGDNGVYSVVLTFTNTSADFSNWSEMFGGINIVVTGSGTSFTGTYTKSYNNYDYYIKHETVGTTTGYYLHPITTFPVGDVYITSYEDYRHNHIYKTEGSGESAVNYFTDEYVYDSGLKDRKMMHITHQFKQPKFKPFDMKATITINNNIGLNKRESIKSAALEYMRTTYGPYSDTLGESVSRYDIRTGLMNIDGVKSVSIEYLGYDLGTAVDDYEELLCDFNQKLIPASTEKPGDIIIHGLDITVENEEAR